VLVVIFMKRVRVIMGICVMLLSLEAAGETAGKDEAKKLFEEGKALVEQGLYEEAIEKLESSYELNPVPLVLYNIAVCFDRLHSYAAAVEYYNLYLIEEKKVPEERRMKIAERLGEISRFLGKLKLTVSENGAEVYVDGDLAGQTPLKEMYLETGGHDLGIKKEGFVEVKKHVTVISEETVELSIALEKKGGDVKDEKEAPVQEGAAAETSAKNKRRKLGPAAFWALVSLTAASGAAMAVTGGLALKKDRDVADMYDYENWQDVRDERERLELATNVLIGITAASAIAALTVSFFTDFGREKNRAGFISVPPGGRGLVFGYGGTF